MFYQNFSLLTECQPPRPLINGKYLGNMNQVGSKRVVVCNDGYIERNEIRNIKCMTDGEWDHDPACESKCSVMNLCYNHVLLHFRERWPNG